MKKVIIIGASGSLAKYVIAALEKQSDVKLTLFVRNKNRLPKNASNHLIVEGDAINYDTVKKAITGQDIVYVNLTGELRNDDKKYCQSNGRNRCKTNYCHQFHRHL